MERRILLTTTVLLLLYGLVMAYSASTAKAFFSYGSSWYLIERQAFFAVVGVIAMIALARVDYVVWRRSLCRSGCSPWPACWSCSSRASARRSTAPAAGSSWPDFRTRPASSPSWPASAWWPASSSSAPRDVLTAGGFTRLVFIGIAPAAVLIMAEPDLGTTIILVFSVMAVVVAAGARVRHLVVLGSLGVAGVAMAIVVEPYRMARLTSFVNPWKDPREPACRPSSR